MQVNSLLRSIIVAGAVAGVPASLAAQSCLGYALAPSQHALSFVINDQGGAVGAGAGGAVSGVMKNNSSYLFQTTVHEVETFPGTWENMIIWQAQLSQPVLRKTPDAKAGPCALLELGGVSFMESTSTNAGIGFGYSLNQPKYALFAAPVFGMVQSGDFNDTYLKVIGGAGTRLGALHVGIDVNLPVQPSGGETTMNFRLGFGWGKATAIPAPRVRTSSTQSTVAGGAATAPQSASAPSAGTKPYALDDIEAMVKNGVATSRILELSKQSCLSFRMSDDADTRLRRVGADATLLSGLRQSCYSAS